MQQTVLLTGASGQVGSVIAHTLIGDGYQVIGTVHSEQGLDELRAAGVDGQVLDLTVEADVQSFVDRLDDPPVAAVMTVGGFAMGDLANTSGADLRRMYQLNFETAYFLVRALLPVFAGRGGGQFVLIGARPALDAAAGKDMTAYALSKGLVFHLADLINAYGRKKRITATVIVPSIIDTPANRTAMPDADPEQWVSREAIAETVRFILSDAGRQMREGVIKLYNEA
ncbi:MAG: SDR family NAD(P)-dependent oxidoreductase [Saprospiraceae bacterium]|nr:SDR family NAD(P)-dependent oxidoreductase [Saprospiraceae bacterium]